MNRDRLATVVRIRRLQERIARGEVARDRAAAHAREIAEQDAVALLDDAELGVPRTPDGLRAHRRMLGRGVRDVGDAAAAVADAHQQVAVAVSGWTRAAQRLDGMERLDGRLAQEAEAERARLEQAEIDDLVVMRWDPDR